MTGMDPYPEKPAGQYKGTNNQQRHNFKLF